MRPTRQRQSAQRCPLNHVLGTEAAVRVLRVLTLSEIPLGVSELARQAALQISGVARVCTRLEDLGAIETVGRGSAGRQYRRAQRYALGLQLMGLFQQERIRADNLLQALMAAVRSLSPPCLAAWVEGPFATATDEPGDPIVVGVLAEVKQVENLRQQAWQQLLHVQKHSDVSVELQVATLADLLASGRERRAELKHILLLAGPSPLDLLAAQETPRRRAGTAAPDHKALDARSHRHAVFVAERLRRDPTLIERAVRYLEQKIPAAAPGERLELQEWHDVLTTLSPARLRRFLTEDSARARRLRQSSPFPAVLTTEERRALRSDGARAT